MFTAKSILSVDDISALKSEYVYIFGAHSRARTLGVYISSLFPGTKIKAYLVDDNEENPCDVEGVPVIHMHEAKDLDCNVPVFIGTRGVSHGKITKVLEGLSFKSIIPVTPDLDIELRNKYIPKLFSEKNWKFEKLDCVDPATDKDATLYIARSAADVVDGNYPEVRPFEQLIQVGCDLTDERIEGIELFDNEGENISRLNKQFCELTALYWIWKNSKTDIVGLEHFRRRFILRDGWSEAMRNNGIDVILPVPLFVAPSLAANFCDRHEPKVWNTMMEILKKSPDSYEMAKEYFECNGTYSPCNMLIARKPVLDELCSWLFPILFELSEKIGTIDDKYQNRYPGFVSERLISFWFHMNRDKYSIVYADKSFLG